MIKIYGFQTFNPLKVLYVGTHLGHEFEYIQLDPSKGEHKSVDYMKIHPLGKVPAMTYNGQALFESVAMCKLLARLKPSSLYPEDVFQRSLVDQWCDFFSCHFGRWLTVPYWERVIKSRIKAGPADEKKIEEALGFFQQQAAVVDRCLASNKYLTGEHMSIADYVGFAYLEIKEDTEIPVSDFPNMCRWYDKIRESEPVKTVKKLYCS